MQRAPERRQFFKVRWFKERRSGFDRRQRTVERISNKMKIYLWEAVHNLVAHPLLTLTFKSRFANWLHDVTATKAFPRQPLGWMDEA
jgi:hypothetical protein